MAAPTFVQVATGSAQSTTVAVAAPTGTVSGHHQVIWLGVPSTTITVTSVPAGWLLERTQQNTNDATPFTLRCYKSSTATGSASFTVSASTTLAAVRVAYSGGTGVESSVGSADSGSSTNHALATATTTVADSLVVAAGYEDSSSSSKTHTMSGWTERADFTTSGLTRVGMIAAYDIVKAAPGTQGGTIVSSAADLMATISVVLAAPAGTIHAKTGGGASSTAGAGSDVTAPANFVNKTGGAASPRAGSGVKALGKAWAKAGGGASSRAGSGAKALANVPPDQLPGDVLDLSCWHLTTPHDSGDGDAEQIDQPELDSYESPLFYVDELSRVVCIAPTDGFTTSGASGATRMEFRQRRKGSYDHAAMDPNAAGRWQMTITTYADWSNITGGTTPRKEGIIAQIHGAGSSPIPLILAAEYHVSPPRVRIYKNGPGLANPITSITPDTPLTIRIRIGGGRLKVWAIAGFVTDLPDPLTSTAPYDWPISDFTDQEGWYYKGGSYNKTTISSGSSGEGIAKVAYLNVLEPADDEEQSSTTYDKTGSAARLHVGSGAKTFDEHETSVETGGAARVNAASGAKTFTPATVYTKAGGASSVRAGSAAAVRVPATVHTEIGGGSTRAAGRGSDVLTSATVHAKTGGATTSRAGAGVRERLRTSTGGAASSRAGSGAKSTASATTYLKTGGAAALYVAEGHQEESVVHARTGGGATSRAGSGAIEIHEPTIYDRSGGAAATPVGAGTYDVRPATVYDRTGGAAAREAAAGARQRVVVRAGGAAVLGAARGPVEQVLPLVRDLAGGAATSRAGSGEVELDVPTVHAKTGGAASRRAGSGGQDVVPAVVHEKTGGAATSAAGLCLVEVIPAADYALTGGAALVGAGSARRRVGGRLHATVPVVLPTFRAGTPVRR